MNGRRQPSPSGTAVLLVSDGPERLASLRATLEGEGHRVLAVDSARAGFALLDTETAALLVVEQRLCAVYGDALARRLRERDAGAQVLVVGADTDGPPPRELLRRLGLHGYHAAADGGERLLVLTDAALASHRDLSRVQLAERLKTELLGSVSHEFRTPLNVIIGYVDLLQDGTFGACDPETRPVFDKLRGNATYLLELAEEFLDLSRLEAETEPGRPQTVDPIPLLRELADWFSLLVRDRPVAFEADIPPGLPTLAAESAKLRVVVQNLLSNAAKFTGEGRIRLAAATLADGRVAIRVSDTGPGIAPEHHEAVFDMFRQLRPTDGRRNGVGLGLALGLAVERLRRGQRAPYGRRHHRRERGRPGSHLHRRPPGGGGDPRRAGRPRGLTPAARVCRRRHACVAACARWHAAAPTSRPFRAGIRAFHSGAERPETCT